MRQASLANEEIACEYWERIKNLKKLNEFEKLKTIVDCFHDDENVYCIHEIAGDLTLADVMQDAFPRGCEEGFAHKTISAVGKIMNTMH